MVIYSKLERGGYYMNNKDQVDMQVEKRGFDMTHERWSPKWKYFKPPMWWIFRWAYDIKKTLYTNCYPIAVNTGGISIASKPIVPTDSIEIEFNGTSFRSEAIEKKANAFMANIKSVMDEKNSAEDVVRNFFISKGFPNETVNNIMNRMVPEPNLEDPRFPMLICNDCVIGKYGSHIVPKEGCIHSGICTRSYHLGFVDGVCDEGMRTDMYRGDHAYREREDSK